MSYCIYTLASSLTPDVIRWVGLTGTSPARRFEWHLRNARDGEDSVKSRWIRKVTEEGGEIVLKTLDAELTSLQAQRREIFYISEYRQRGYPLLNKTYGGEIGSQQWRLANQATEDA